MNFIDKKNKNKNKKQQKTEKAFISSNNIDMLYIIGKYVIV